MTKPLVLQNKNLCLLWSSQLISQVGNRMFQIAILWYFIKQSANPGLNSAIFMIMAALPAIGLVKLIGRTVDKSSRKKILLFADFSGTITSLVLLGAVIFDLNLTPWFWGVSLIFSILQAFIDPSLQKSVPEIIESNKVEQALAYLSSTASMANAAGAISGALLLELLGLKGIIIVNGLSYFLSFLLDSQLALKSDGKNTNKVLSSEDEAPAFSMHHYPAIRNILGAFAIVNFFCTPIFMLLPYYTKVGLNLGVTWLGFFEATICLGLIAGSFLSPKLPLKGRVIHLIFFLLIISSVTFIIPAFVFNPFVYLIAFALLGVCFGALNNRIVGFFHKVIPNEFKGNFFAGLQAIISAIIPVSYFMFGLLMDYLTPRDLFLVQFSGVFLMSLLFFVFRNKPDDQLSYRVLPKGVAHEI